MEKLFETAWREKIGKRNFYYKRVFDPETQKSSKVEIPPISEWYTIDPSGEYRFILDEKIKLSRIESQYSIEGINEYGYLDPMYKHIRDEYWNKDLNNNNPRILYMDIETRSGQNSVGFPVAEKALEEVSLIQIFDNVSKIMFVIGLRDWKHESEYKFDYEVKYINAETEYNLFETFFKIYKSLDPLIVYAWNGLGFDFPYLYNRAKMIGHDVNRFSNYGTAQLTEKEFNGKIEFKINVDGHHWLDLMDVYKTFVYKARTSYSLDNIASVELKENKVQHTEYAAFDDFYTGKYIIPENPRPDQLNSKIYQHAIKFGVDDECKELSHSEFVYYGIKDTYLIYKIDDKLKFTALLTMIAEKMGVLISNTMSTVKPWSHFIGNRAMINKQVMPPKKDRDDSPNIIGGFVRDPQKGKHKWVLSCDVNSMYPLLGMVGFNNSPETFVPKHKLPKTLKDIILRYFNDQNESDRFEIPEEIWSTVKSELTEHNLSLAINGAVFDCKQRGMIPELVQEIYDTRKIYKKTQFKYEQQKLAIEEILRERNVK